MYLLSYWLGVGLIGPDQPESPFHPQEHDKPPTVLQLQLQAKCIRPCLKRLPLFVPGGSSRLPIAVQPNLLSSGAMHFTHRLGLAYPAPSQNRRKRFAFLTFSSRLESPYPSALPLRFGQGQPSLVLHLSLDAHCRQICWQMISEPLRRLNLGISSRKYHLKAVSYSQLRTGPTLFGKALGPQLEVLDLDSEIHAAVTTAYPQSQPFH